MKATKFDTIVPESEKDEGKAFGVSSANKASGWLVAMLVAYVFLKGSKIGEPFVFLYQTEQLNLTSTQLTGEVYHLSAYTCAILIVPAFLLADILLSKPFMYLEVVGHLGYRAALVFGTGLFSQKVGKVFYGFTAALDFVFFSYTYYVIDKQQYRRVTTWTRAGVLAGRLVGAVIAQIVIMTAIGSYWTLNCMAFAITVLVFALCVALPRVGWKQLARSFQQREKEVQRFPTSYREFATKRLNKLWHEFCVNYAIGTVRKWSFWWALTTCMHMLLGQFYQAMFGEVQAGDRRPWNALAEVVYTLLAFVSILGFNKIPLDWDRWGELVLVVISSIDAGLLFVFASAQSIYPMFACYIGYRVLHQVMITIAQWNIAKSMVGSSFGLVFGVNSSVAFLLQSIVMRTFTASSGLGLPIRSIFLVFTYTHVFISFVFMASLIYGYFSKKCRRHQESAVEE